jgi:1,4-alpha-glucan branching enzyme
MVTKLPGRAGTVRVTFALPATIWADTVHVVGDFNGWNERATPLRLTETAWMTTLELEAGREYQYRYLLNGNEWHNDWHADRYVPNAYGGDNSVVITPCFTDAETEIGGLAERVIAFAPAPRRQAPAS